MEEARSQRVEGNGEPEPLERGRWRRGKREEDEDWKGRREDETQG